MNILFVRRLVHKDQKKRRINRRYTIALAALLVLLVIVMARGWVRNNVLSWYGNQTVGKQVNTAFESSFTSINQQFQDVGIHLAKAPLAGPTCFTANYHYFRASVWCLRLEAIDNGSNNSPTPQGLINNWPVALQSLQVSKTQGAWQNDASNTNVADPAKLFSFTSTARNNVGFTRRVGGVQCSLTVSADPAQGGYPSAYFINEECHRDINFFGGWDCTKDYCQP